VSCPDSVPAGEVFFVDIETDAEIEGLFLRWLDRDLELSWRREKNHVNARVLLGVGLEDRLDSDLYALCVTAETAGGQLVSEHHVRRVPKDYPEQHLEVSSKFVELSDTDLARHEQEKKQVRDALEVFSSPPYSDLPFMLPVLGDMTSAFGLRRFFNGEPKRSHGGVDLRAAEGDTILCCAHGRVLLADDHFFAGNSVYVDHGQGVVSMYFHLSRIDVKEGQMLLRGDPVGLAGATGRVTGPHLHWGVSVLGQLVDPLTLVGASKYEETKR
jgi:murein DD-endopeptidase MepM/ murein hydrolase activator NlpD